MASPRECGRSSHPRLDHPTRHLPGAEPGNAYFPTEPPDDLLECPVDFRLVDLDGKADLVALFGSRGGAHTK